MGPNAGLGEGKLNAAFRITLHEYKTLSFSKETGETRKLSCERRTRKLP